jgi:hypothetical protein
MTPQEFEAMQGLETATLLSIAAERPNPRQQAALHILEIRRQTTLQASDTAKPKIDWVRVGAIAGIAGVAAVVFIYLFSYLLSR